MKKVIVDIKLAVMVHVDEDVDFEEFMCNSEYHIHPATGGDVIDVQLEDYTVRESR